MRILYYSFEHAKQEYGGNVILKRNLAYLKKLAGEENVVSYSTTNIPPGFTRILRGLQKLTGFELFADRKLLKELGDFDYVFIDGTARGSFSRRTIRKIKAITFFHNVEYDYYCQKNAGARGLKKLKSYLQNRTEYYYERRLCKNSEVIITLNQRDSDHLKQLYGRGSDLLLPTSMEDAYQETDFPQSNDASKYLLFVGSDFFGNTEGLFWFCEKCMPYVKMPLIVAGLGMDKYKDRYSSDNIQFYGYVDDLAGLYRNAAAVVLPIISGSGMKTKTCEAMMQGKVIFGTRESFEGYQLSEDCILCNDAGEFIEKINSYLDAGARPYSAANRELFLKNYEKSVVEKKFLDFFSRIKA